MQSVDLIDASENYNKIAVKGQIWSNQVFDIVKTLPLIPITNGSGGTNLPSMPTGLLKIRNLSGNEPMYIGGVGDDSPYILPNGIWRGYELLGDREIDWPVSAPSTTSIVAAHSGQRVNVIAFLNGNDLVLNLNDPDPADFVAPNFLISSPYSGQSGIEYDLRSPDVLYSGFIAVTFDEALSDSSGNFVSGNLNVRASGDLFGLSGVLSLLSGDPTTMVFDPISGLSGGRMYQVHVGPGLMDAAANILGVSYTIPFVTRGTAGPAQLVSTWPSSGASGIVLGISGASGASGTRFWATFDRDLISGSTNANSGNIALRIYGSNSGWSGTQFIGGDGRTIVFQAASKLSGNATYELVLGSGIKEARYGIPLGQTITVPFISDASPSPPTFLRSWPSSGASGLAFDLNSSGGSGYVSVTFNKSLYNDATNLVSGIISLRVSGSSGLAGNRFFQGGDDHTIVFDPTGSLSGSKIYEIVVGSGLREAAGLVPFGQTLIIPFLTDANPPPPDTTPPFVASFSPTLNELGVSVSATMQFVYNEKIDSSTVITNGVGLWQAGNKVSGTLSVGADLRTITFTPNAALSGSTVYNIRASGVKDIVGNQQTAASGFSGGFTTQFVDVTPPYVSSIDPARGASSVIVSMHPTATFNEAVLASSVSTSTVQLYQAGSVVAGSVSLSADNLTATFTPNSNLSGSTIYNLRVSGVSDIGNNVMTAASGYSGAFTTAAIDNTPPFVSSVNPARGASGLATSTHPTITYNEALLPSSVSTSTIALYQAGSPVAGTVSLDGTNTVVTFTPNSALLNSTVYNMRASGAKDAAGNTQSAASGYSGAFTTQSAGQGGSLFYNASDNGDSRNLSSTVSRRAGWRFGAGSLAIGKKIVKAQVTLQRNEPGSAAGPLGLNQLDSVGSIKQKFFLNGNVGPDFSTFSTSKTNYVWEISGTPSVTVAANDVLVLEASGFTGTGDTDYMEVFRNSNDVDGDGAKTRWCSTDWSDTTHVITTDQSGMDMAGLLYEAV